MAGAADSVPSAPDVTSDSRARARSLTVPPLAAVEDRVEYIVGLMVDGVWDETTTRSLQLSLAAAWQVEPSTVRNYSAEASRAIRTSLRESASGRASRAMRRLEHLAITRADSQVPGDAAAAVRCNEIILRSGGHDAPEEQAEKVSTTIQILIPGTVATSPATRALMGAEETAESPVAALTLHTSSSPFADVQGSGSDGEDAR